MTALGSSIAEYGRVAINIYITLGCGTTHTHHTHHTAHFDKLSLEPIIWIFSDPTIF